MVGAVSAADPAVSPDDTVRVVASGMAPVYGGNVRAARTAALQAAYAEAISQGSGTEIGRLTLIRNVRAVTDVVSSRARGFIRSYDVVGEDLLEGPPSRYEVRIVAQVSQSVATEETLGESLRLFLEVIGNPKLLVLLPHRRTESERGIGAASESAEAMTVDVEDPSVRIKVTKSAGKKNTVAVTGAVPAADDDGLIGGIEAAVAQAFTRYGYQVATSDDLVAGGLCSAAQLARARQGITADALAVARAADADLLLTGVVRVESQSVRPHGVDFVSVTAEASAKAIVVSNGYVIDAFHRTTTKAHPSRLGAFSATIEVIAKQFADALAWKVPSLLASRPRSTRLVVRNVDLPGAQAMKGRLEGIEGVEAVRFVNIPTMAHPETVLEVMTSFVRLEPDELAAVCASGAGTELRIASASKFELQLVATGPGSRGPMAEEKKNEKNRNEKKR